MFGNHVENQLTAYLHGELAESAALKVRNHVASCDACRQKLRKLEFAARAVRSLPLRSAPDSVWERIDQRISAESPVLQPSHGFRWQWAAAAAMAVLIAVVVVGRGYFTRGGFVGTVGGGSPGPVGIASAKPVFWAVEAVKGAPVVGAMQLRGKGKLASGQWLETDSRSAARVKIADIGRANIMPNSRLSLVSSAKNEHRMRLERGELHAKVNAPPRLFVVETPSATAVDLGCEYTLTANPDGSSLLKVMSGWVAMEIAAHASYVPATMACITRPNQIPGTPYRQDAPKELIEALKRYDFGGQGTADLDDVLKRTRKVDGLTLWHLLERAAPEQKRTVFNSLNKLIPAPKGVTFEKAAAGDREAKNAWKDKIELVMFPSTGFSFSDLAVNVMKMQQKGVKK